MSGRLLGSLLLGLLVAMPCFSQPAAAGDLLGLLRPQCGAPAAERTGSAARFVAVPPNPPRYFAYNVGDPWCGYGPGVPTFNYGYFGAKSRPIFACHNGYYNNYCQWHFGRGY